MTQANTIRLGIYLTSAEHDDRASSWTRGVIDAVEGGFPVSIEGIDWQTACHNHGFYGAIMKIKAAHRARKQALALASTNGSD